ncbi:MAG: ATP-dependent zinc metalloprotease FtsH [Bacteroidales bacterium]|nr:ATP-dependent zinc metalloprotease FtsH [Bacteroidales bacterium]MCL2132815.1 ATP-dependent zinc metalloprotease FtsH [Bacteroidales bacterium]
MNGSIPPKGPPPPPQRPNANGKRPRVIMWFYLLIGGFIMYMWVFNNGKSPVQVQWQEVKEQIITSGDVAKLSLITNINRVEVYIKKDSISKYNKKLGFTSDAPKSGPQFYFVVQQYTDAYAKIEEVNNSLPLEEQFKIDTEERNDYLGRLFEWLTFPILLLLLWFFMFRRMSAGFGGGPGGGGIFSVGRSKAQLFDKDHKNKITFKDVAGLEEAKVEVMEIVDFLKNPKKYTELGGKIPKGALLIGPPGTGKTMLAKAVAGEADVPFFSLSGSDFVEMFVGVGASRVRDLFRQAKEKAPCIVFIDEIDAVGRARSKNAGFTSNDERENTLNQLLTEMDGFGSNTGVIILAATNRADILDKALLRAGRFDRQIHVDLPEFRERLDIFKVHLRGLKLVDGFELDFLAKQTPGFSGADIANVCNEAALIAARKNKKTIEKQDFLDAIDRIIGGLERKSKIITQEEKRAIAFHEAGHATVSWMLDHATPLVKVTIIPRGRALGAAWYLPEERQITTTEQLCEEMAATLGGRAAEELVLGRLSTGAVNDLERVTKQAYAMVSYFGMSEKVGNRSYYDSSGQYEFGFSRPYSEKTAELLDDEVKNLIDKAYDTAKQILTTYMEGFTKLAELLLEREVIFADDVEQIFGPRRKPSRQEELLREA